MANKYISAAKVILLTLGIPIISVIFGLVIGGMTFDWWYQLMFSGPKGAVILGLIVFVVAFMVPFLGALVTQLLVLFFIKRKN